MSKVVIIGGSYAGLTTVSIVAKNDPSASITLISPSTHAFFNVAAPRLIVEPELFGKTVFPVAEAVQANSQGRGKFIVGSATKVEPESNTVQYTTVSGDAGELEYDFLVVASGTQTEWAGFKTNTDYKDAQREILEASQTLKCAKRVAVVGGGPTGVETAAEIASVYKEVCVDLYAGKAPLESLSPSLSEEASRKLKALGVHIFQGFLAKTVRAAGEPDRVVTEQSPGKRTETAYDLVIECYVARPYTAYLPDSVKDARGYVLTDHTLTVAGHSNICAFGDVVSGGGHTVVDLKMGQIGPLTRTIRTWANGGTEPRGFFLWEWLSSWWSVPATGSYSPVNNTYLVPISRAGGVGMLFGWRVPNLMVYFAKAKSFMVEGARGSFFV